MTGRKCDMGEEINRETRYYYDKKGQLSRQEDPGNVVKEYSYDLCRNRQSFRLTRKDRRHLINVMSKGSYYLKC